MDKQEYKLRAEEIKSLIAKRDFFNAVKIADGFRKCTGAKAAADKILSVCMK